MLHNTSELLMYLLMPDLQDRTLSALLARIKNLKCKRGPVERYMKKADSMKATYVNTDIDKK